MSGVEANGLPDGWVTSTLAEVFDHLQYGFTAKAEHDGSSGPKFLRITDLQVDGVDWATVPFCQAGEAETAKYLLNDGDFVFARSGSIEKAWRAVAPPVAVFASYLIRGRPLHSDVGPWLQHFIRSGSYLEQIGAAGAGSGMSNVNAVKLGAVRFPVAPTHTRKRIVAKIEALEARSEAAKEALDAIPPLLEKFRQSVLAAAFRGDLTKKWREANPDVEPASVLLERIRDERRRKWQKAHPNKKYVEPKPADTDGLPELPEGWCWASVEELASLVTKGASPGWQGFEYNSEGIMFIRSQNVGWGELRLDDVAHVPVSLNAHQPRSVIAEADVLVNIVGASIGRVALADDRLVGANTNQAVAIIRLVADGLLPAALKYWMLSPETQRRVHLGKVDVARANYSLTDIATLPVPLPPRAEQRAAVDQIESLTAQYDAVKVLTNAAAEAISVLNHSILAKAFRGELVPQDPNDEPAAVLLDRIRQERENGSSKPARKRKP
jgi:type I restriction enzyme S subunit